MKIILTENQIEFIRRYEKIKELIDEGIDVISNDEDFCGFNSSAFIEEVCWQVSDKMEHLNLPTDTVGMNDDETFTLILVIPNSPLSTTFSWSTTVALVYPLEPDCPKLTLFNGWLVA